MRAELLPRVAPVEGGGAAPWRLRLPARPQLWIGCLLFVPVLAAALFAEALAPHDPWASVAPPFLPPGAAHPFGTDNLGRDLLSAVIAGARTSLLVGFAAGALSLAIGTVLGVAAGFLGGWTDDLLMRLTELVQVLPRFFLAILAVGLFGARLETLVLVLGLTAWPGLARIARAEALSLAGRDFVRAARAMGGGHGRILARHIMPNAARPIVAASSLVIGGAILAEAGLGYLGLADPNVVSWGRLLGNAQGFLHRAWWLAVFPGAAIALTVAAIALIIGDWQRD